MSLFATALDGSASFQRPNATSSGVDPSFVRYDVRTGSTVVSSMGFGWQALLAIVGVFVVFAVRDHRGAPGVNLNHPPH